MLKPAAHPVLTGVQIVGLTLSAVSFLAAPVLGVVGFTAAWQASIGAVEAGSLFAWCQSAAIGGAALSGIQVAGVVGAAEPVKHEDWFSDFAIDLRNVRVFKEALVPFSKCSPAAFPVSAGKLLIRFY
ncbi:hypothetical protein GJ744_002033 [Endocarpon pusillum]|uniref:Uncharacterized protein n=1 Tax=Endocarpon pusillum TaxID=364733 RepID=A0A8H7ACH5_9EURO|nr:hypothetical protein GJ744_002033 [Endocarpon pusillum]